MVDADGKIRDDAEAPGQRPDDLGVEALGVAGHRAVDVLALLDQLGPGIDPILHVEDGVVVALEPLVHGVGQAAGDEDPGPRHQRSSRWRARRSRKKS